MNLEICYAGARVISRDILDETPQEIQNLETELVVFKSLEEGLAKISKKVLELMVKTKEEDEYYED